MNIVHLQGYDKKVYYSKILETQSHYHINITFEVITLKQKLLTNTIRQREFYVECNQKIILQF